MASIVPPPSKRQRLDTTGRAGNQREGETLLNNNPVRSYALTTHNLASIGPSLNPANTKPTSHSKLPTNQLLEITPAIPTYPALRIKSDAAPSGSRSTERDPITQIDALPATLSRPITLALPEQADGSSALLYKLQQVVRVVKEGKSVAEATAYQGADYAERDPQKLLREKLSSLEKMCYRAWIDGRVKSLPTVDWLTSMSPVGGEKSQKALRRKALVIYKIWEKAGTTMENAKWVSENLQEYQPLVKAVMKEQGVEIALRGEQTILTATDLADLQTLRKIIAVSTRHMRDNSRNSKSLFREIDQCIRVFVARLHHLTSMLSDAKRSAMAELPRGHKHV